MLYIHIPPSYRERHFPWRRRQRAPWQRFGAEPPGIAADDGGLGPSRPSGLFAPCHHRRHAATVSSSAGSSSTPHSPTEPHRFRASGRRLGLGAHGPAPGSARPARPARLGPPGSARRISPAPRVRLLPAALRFYGVQAILGFPAHARHSTMMTESSASDGQHGLHSMDRRPNNDFPVVLRRPSHPSRCPHDNGRLHDRQTRAAGVPLLGDLCGPAPADAPPAVAAGQTESTCGASSCRPLPLSCPPRSKSAA
jgi:hypothetical protein